MMKYLSLAEIGEDINSGFACRPGQSDAGVLQLRPYSITSEGKIDLSQSKYVACDKAKFAKYNLRDGDILFNNTNSPELVGKTALFKNNVECVFSNHLTRIRVKKDVADSGYVARYLHNLFSLKVFFTRCQQWVNQAAFPKTEIEKLKIPVPPLPVQRKIAAILEKAESALEKRRKATRLTDEFLKSAFLDMFGDPVRNAKNVRGLPEICEINLRLEAQISEDTEVSFVPMSAVSGNGVIDVSRVRKFGEVKKGFTYFGEDDVLFAKITPCMENGKGAIAKNLKNGIGFGSTEFHVLRPYKDEANSEWLYFLLSFKHIREIAARCFTGTAGQKRVPVSFLENLKVSVPSYNLQQKFAALVEKVETVKQKQRASETELRNLFNALMQRAFRGGIAN